MPALLLGLLNVDVFSILCMFLMFEGNFFEPMNFIFFSLMLQIPVLLIGSYR